MGPILEFLIDGPLPTRLLLCVALIGITAVTIWVGHAWLLPGAIGFVMLLFIIVTGGDNSGTI